jgi:hypothetical protein
MRTPGTLFIAGGVTLALLLAAGVPARAQVKPTGAPLVLSNIETEQPIPLASLDPDGKTAKCTNVRLHWVSQPDVGPNDDATSFTIDLPAENPAEPIFLAQLWNASLASALAWQQPWEGARWKVLDTPATDGSGLDAPLAVGMIATSARRPYPPKTVVIGSLNPDGSLGPVSHLLARLEAAAHAGMKRAIIPSVQRFDTDENGSVVNVVRQATDLGLECVPVDDLVTATETVMNDPLPDAAIDAALPKYSNEVSNFIDEYTRREQSEVEQGLRFAPKEADLNNYPAHLAGVWKSVYADYESGQEAYTAGQVFVAYELFARADGRMNGANALTTSSRASFDVKSALADADNLHAQLHQLSDPPTIDHSDLQSAVVVAQMADWAYDLNAALEGAELVTKQAFSTRSDATEAEKDRARESIVFANAECRSMLSQSDFYLRLLDHVAAGEPINVDANAGHLLPQLIPAQLATARRFTAGIRASDLRDGLLFDPRLVAYVNVLRQIKSEWDAHLRRKDDAATAAAAPADTAASGTVELNSHAPVTSAGFDPGNTYRPPSAVVAASNPTRKLSDPAQCLIWANHDCDIATLDEKYLRLSGAMDPTTHDWKIKDRAKLDSLLQMAEIGARRGISFAAKTGIDDSVLAMIYEKAAQERTRGSDLASLDALRNYWRCALLGNMCWQLAHTHKAEPVDLNTLADDGKGAKKSDKSKKDDKSAADGKKGSDVADKDAKPSDETKAETSTTTPPATVVTVDPHGAATTAPETPAPNLAPGAEPPAPPPAPVVATPAPAPAPQPEAPVAPVAVPVAPAVTEAPPVAAPVAAPVVATQTPSPAPVAGPVHLPPAPAPTPSAPDVEEANIPVAPIAKHEDLEPAPKPAPASPAPAPAANVVPPAVPVAPVAPIADDANIPVAPVAKATDLNASDVAPATNAAPVAPPVPPAVVPAPPPAKSQDNADGHGNAF